MRGSLLIVARVQMLRGPVEEIDIRNHMGQNGAQTTLNTRV